MSDSAFEAQTPSDPSATVLDIESQFRVISTGPRRRGIRLEHIYWRLFDAIARQRGLKRSDLLVEVLGNGADAENVSSVIRCYVTAQVERERDVLRQQVDPSHTIAMMQKAPVPAFAINRQKKLQQVNPEFMALLRPAATSSGRSSAEYVHLSLDTPIDDLFAAAAAGQDAQCGYQLQVDDRRRRGRARIVLVPNATPETLVGYVLS